MYRMRPPNSLRGRLGESQIAHLPCLDELLHRANGLLDRYLWVHPVLVVEIYHVHAETLERGLARHLHIFRLTVDADPASVLAPFVAELGSEDDLVPSI